MKLLSFRILVLLMILNILYFGWHSWLAFNSSLTNKMVSQKLYINYFYLAIFLYIISLGRYFYIKLSNQYSRFFWASVVVNSAIYTILQIVKTHLSCQLYYGFMAGKDFLSLVIIFHLFVKFRKQPFPLL